MDSKRSLKLTLATIAAVGALSLVDFAEQNPINYTLMGIAGFVTAICFLPLVAIEYSEKRKIPKSAKPKLSEMEKQWWHFHNFQFDFPWYFIVFVGIAAESMFLYVSELLFVSISLFYLLSIGVVFNWVRNKFHMTLTATAFLFFTCVVAAPFSAAAMRQPQFLSTVFPLSIPNSREAAALLFLYSQVALIFSSAMLVTHTWRLGLLRKNKFDGLAMRDLVSKIITNRFDSEHFDTVQGINQDIPLVVQSFSEGNSALTISLGWSAILRGLDVLVEKKVDPYKKAEEAGINLAFFKDGKRMRNEFAHGHYSPTLNDSLTTLVLLKEVLEKLSVKPNANQAAK